MIISVKNETKESVLIYPYMDNNKTNIPQEILLKINKNYFNEKGNIKKIFNNEKEIILYNIGDNINLENIRIMASHITKFIITDFIENCDVLLNSNLWNLNSSDVLTAFCEGLLLTEYSFDEFKTNKKKQFEIKAINIINDENINNHIEIINKIETIIKSINMVKDLVNNPANIVNIDYLEMKARTISEENKLTIKIKDKNDLKKEGFNLLYSVGQAGKEEPRLIEVYYNAGKQYKTICLVGKGVVFDTGGLHIKTEDHMDDMKCDMAGAASVLGIIEIAAKLKLQTNIIALLPLAENAIDSLSYRPGDIIKSYDGKTVEILNTDAEGRLILADALSYSDSLNPDLTIDIATLTGACTIALGDRIAGFFTKNDKYKELISDSSKFTGEMIWELPLFEEYKNYLKSDIADLGNIGNPPRQGGCILGALFLSEFVKNNNWIHFDIASVAYSDKGWNYNSKGGTGFLVRTLVKFIENLG